MGKGLGAPPQNPLHRRQNQQMLRHNPILHTPCRTCLRSERLRSMVPPEVCVEAVARGVVRTLHALRIPDNPAAVDVVVDCVEGADIKLLL